MRGGITLVMAKKKKKRRMNFVVGFKNSLECVVVRDLLLT